MARLQRLLAATDLSAPARHAAERAASVARASGAALDLVHVGAVSLVAELGRLVPGLPADIPARIREQEQMQVDALAASLQERYGVTARTQVVKGPLPQALEEAASAGAADLLVLGARGRSMLRHLVLGSTAERLVGSFSRPLLVVKRAPATDYRCVLVPVDFSPSSLEALQLAHAVAPDARVVLLHAYEAPFEGKLLVAGVEDRHLEDYRSGARSEAQHRMTALCEQSGVPAEKITTVLAHGAASLRILEQEQDRDCDLIVIGRQGQSRVDDLLLGSVSRRVLVDAESDVLVLP